MDATSSVDPLEQIYAPPIPDEWRQDLATYREMIATRDLARYYQARREALAKRASVAPLREPLAIDPALRSFMEPPKETPDIIEDKVQRLINALDARDKLAST